MGFLLESNLKVRGKTIYSSVQSTLLPYVAQRHIIGDRAWQAKLCRRVNSIGKVAFLPQESQDNASSCERVDVSQLIHIVFMVMVMSTPVDKAPRPSNSNVI